MKLYKVFPIAKIHQAGESEPNIEVKCVYVCAANKADAKRAAVGVFPKNKLLMVDKVTKEQIVKIDYVFRTMKEEGEDHE